MQAPHEHPERPPRRPSVRQVVVWLALLWLMGYIGIILEQGISWSVPFDGLRCGLIMGAALSPFMLIPWALAGALGYGIGSVKVLRNYRTVLSLLLPACLIFFPVMSSCFDRISPGRRFERLTGAPFPKHHRSLEYHFSGGLLADITDAFIFECPASETEELIRRLHLQKTGDDPNKMIIRPLPSWSAPLDQPELWTPGTYGGRVDYLTLKTDRQRTHVRVVYGNF